MNSKTKDTVRGFVLFFGSVAAVLILGWSYLSWKNTKALAPSQWQSREARWELIAQRETSDGLIELRLKREKK